MHLFFPLRTLFCGCQLFQVLVGLPRCLSGQQPGWLEILALSYLHFWDWDPVVSGAWSMGCAWLKVSHGVGSPKHLGCVIAHSPDIDQPSRQFTSEMVPIQFWPFFFFFYMRCKYVESLGEDNRKPSTGASWDFQQEREKSIVL